LLRCYNTVLGAWKTELATLTSTLLVCCELLVSLVLL
jgi:hypothetical protein